MKAYMHFFAGISNVGTIYLSEREMVLIEVLEAKWIHFAYNTLFR
jgi:hypothetical protein